MRKLANVSVDLDGLAHYHAIHGLNESANPYAIYEVALPRLLDLFDELGVPATLFVIGSDLDHTQAVEALRRATEVGHEAASHSYLHPYNLRQWSKLSIAEDIDRASDALLHAVGYRPAGFRTPGYNLDTRILRLLAERGYRYDSSVLPSPPYYTAKAAVMGAMSLFGKSSGSSMVDPNSLRAPLQPYRPSRWAFWKEGDRKHSLPIWEIPIGVNRVTRVPVIGTTIGALPRLMRKPFYESFRHRQQTIQIELHGIDIMDANDDAIHPQLAKHQPDVNRAWEKKREAIGDFLELAKDHYEFVTLDTMADELDAEAGPTVVV
jgi:hypothetical protein